MKKYVAAWVLMIIIAGACTTSKPQKQNFEDIIPIRGFCIAAPPPRLVDSFIVFIENELAPRQVNTLILRVDFNYQYTSHPELRDSIALSKEEVGKIVAACKSSGIRIIPQVNLLGHQSWAARKTNLLKIYPEFDENPQIIMPTKYEWPNNDNLYCKSYCPLHPELHKVVFALIDEICAVFETDAFHAGMDEVFYLGEDQCPRCAGKSKAILFAGEVNAIHDHLAETKKQLWIWGDRLIDGRTSGIGMWEASYNDTCPAIDLIAKDIMICDWHYERPDKTPVYFALKGFNVVTCPWRNPSIAIRQLKDMQQFRATSTPEMKTRFQGMVQTVWSRVPQFLQSYYEDPKDTTAGGNSQAGCFRGLFREIGKM